MEESQPFVKTTKARESFWKISALLTKMISFRMKIDKRL